MINLLKADLFRLWKSKTFRISLLVVSVITIVLTVGFSYSDGSLSINSIYTPDRVYGFIIGEVTESSRYIEFAKSSLGFTLFICIGMLFIIGDAVVGRYENGMIKNIVSYGQSRCKIYLSNMISIFIGTTVIGLCSFLISMSIFYLILYKGNSISSVEIMKIAKIVFTWMTIICAAASGYTFMATVIKSKAFVVTIGALTMSLAPAFTFYQISDVMKTRIPIFMLLDLCGKPRVTEVLTTFILNSLIIIVLANVVGCMIFRKQDIK